MRGAGAPQAVALVAPSLRLGGLERAVRDLAAGLRDRGIRTGVFVTESAGEYADELARSGVPVHDCGSRRPRIARVPVRLYRGLSRFGPDVIHGHSGTWLPCAVSAALLRRPLLFTDHGRYLPEARYRRFLERRAYLPRTDRVVAVSRELAEYLEGFLALAAPPEVVPNGVDLRAYGRGAGRRESLRAEWGVAAGEMLALAVGRLEPVKNHRGMLAALARARALTPGVRLTIAGTGRLEGETRAHAERLGLGDSVVFLGHRRDIADCMAASDLFLSASISEGLPIALLEAMAAGLPTVATAVGGIPNALGEPPAGLLVPPGDTDGLGDALVRLAADPALRRSLGAAARKRARAFSLDACVQRYCDLYTELVAERSGEPRLAAAPAPRELGSTP